MFFPRLARPVWAVLVGMGVAIAAGTFGEVVSLQAEDPPERKAPEVQSEQGKVVSLLKNDRGDVDGLLLESGLRLHFPPHLGKRIAAVAEAGDTVQVEGHHKVTPRGDKVFEITRLVSGEETVVVEPPPRKRDPKGPREEPAVSLAGRVKDFARNPHEDVDGLILDEGTVVKFPPHQSRDLQELVKVGDKVEVMGRKHVTPHGDVHVHADTIEANGQLLQRERPAHGPKKPGPENHPGHKPGPHAGPRHAPGHAEPGHVGPGHAEQAGPTNAELMRELKAIRRLLEQRDRS